MIQMSCIGGKVRVEVSEDLPASFTSRFRWEMSNIAIGKQNGPHSFQLSQSQCSISGAILVLRFTDSGRGESGYIPGGYPLSTNRNLSESDKTGAIKQDDSRFQTSIDGSISIKLSIGNISIVPGVGEPSLATSKWFAAIKRYRAH